MTHLTWTTVRRRFREPLTTAFGTLRERALLVVTLAGADGVCGYGEAAPLEPYDGISLAAVADDLSRCARALGGVDRDTEIRRTVAATTELAPVAAAIDLALWDRAGRRAARPVRDLIASGGSAAVPVNATIAALAPEAAERRAADAAAAGFSCVKVKVGAGDDAGRLAAVRRAAGPRMAIRIDANGAWTEAEAIALLPQLAAAAGGLELVEEPCHGAAALRAVAAAHPDLTIAADESDAAETAAVCLKIGRSGGITGLLERAARIAARGGRPYLASTFDGPLGIAAAVHCAAALRITTPCGLATLGAFAGRHDELPIASGRIAVPEGPGLGVRA